MYSITSLYCCNGQIFIFNPLITINFCIIKVSGVLKDFECYANSWLESNSGGDGITSQLGLLILPTISLNFSLWLHYESLVCSLNEIWNHFILSNGWRSDLSALKKNVLYFLNDPSYLCKEFFRNWFRTLFPLLSVNEL